MLRNLLQKHVQWASFIPTSPIALHSRILFGYYNFQLPNWIIVLLFFTCIFFNIINKKIKKWRSLKRNSNCASDVQTSASIVSKILFLPMRLMMLEEILEGTKDDLFILPGGNVCEKRYIFLQLHPVLIK